VPDNWEALADMRLRQLDKEYAKCVNFDIKEGSDDYQYQGLKKILNLPSGSEAELTDDQKRKQNLEKQLKMLDMKDLTACNVRSE